MGDFGSGAEGGVGASGGGSEGVAETSSMSGLEASSESSASNEAISATTVSETTTYEAVPDESGTASFDESVEPSFSEAQFDEAASEVTEWASTEGTAEQSAEAPPTEVSAQNVMSAPEPLPDDHPLAETERAIFQTAPSSAPEVAAAGNPGGGDPPPEVASGPGGDPPDFGGHERKTYVRTEFANATDETTGIFENGYQAARDVYSDTTYIDVPETQITQFQRDSLDPSVSSEAALSSRFVAPDAAAADMSAEQAKDQYALFSTPDSAIEVTLSGRVRQSVVAANNEAQGGGVQWEVVSGHLEDVTKRSLLGADQATVSESLASQGNMDAQTVVSALRPGELTRDVAERAGVAPENSEVVTPNMSDAILPVRVDAEENTSTDMAGNARRVDGVISEAASETAALHHQAEEKAATEQAALDQKAAEDKAVTEQAALDQKAAEEKAAAEQQAALDQRAADEKAATEQAALDQKAAEEKAATEQAALDQKAAEQKVALEQKAAEDKAKEELSALYVKDVEERVKSQSARGSMTSLDPELPGELTAVEDAEQKLDEGEKDEREAHIVGDEIEEHAESQAEALAKTHSGATETQTEIRMPDQHPVSTHSEHGAVDPVGLFALLALMTKKQLGDRSDE